MDTCDLGQDQVAGTSKHGNKTSDSMLFWGGGGKDFLRAEDLLSL
jgi:hypothetical protein